MFIYLHNHQFKTNPYIMIYEGNGPYTDHNDKERL